MLGCCRASSQTQSCLKTKSRVASTGRGRVGCPKCSGVMGTLAVRFCQGMRCRVKCRKRQAGYLREALPMSVAVKGTYRRVLSNVGKWSDLHFGKTVFGNFEEDGFEGLELGARRSVSLLQSVGLVKSSIGLNLGNRDGKEGTSQNFPYMDPSADTFSIIAPAVEATGSWGSLWDSHAHKRGLLLILYFQTFLILPYPSRPHTASHFQLPESSTVGGTQQNHAEWKDEWIGTASSFPLFIKSVVLTMVVLLLPSFISGPGSWMDAPIKHEIWAIWLSQCKHSLIDILYHFLSWIWN